MILEDFGILMAPTFRSNVYLQTLVKKNMIPSIAILMESSENDVFPGQASKETLEWMKRAGQDHDFDVSKSITDVLEGNDITLLEIHTNDINSDLVEEGLANTEQKYFIYSGFGGAVVKENILNTGIKLIHAHSGKVPQFRGSTTLYYSILKEDTCYVSAFFLDKNIDTGPLIKVKSYDKPRDGQAIDYVYDASIRAELIAEVIQEYLDTGSFTLSEQNEEGGETYFIIHPVLKHIAILACNSRHA